MKKILLFISVIILFIFLGKLNLANAQLANPACLGITGKFTAQNWKGGPVMVGCNGDAGANCPGQLKKVYPNQSYTLTKCSCPPYADGCLKVAKELKLVKNSAGRPRVQVVGKRLPNSCTITKIANICGTNGNIIKGNFKISCNVAQTPTPEFTGTPTPTTPPSNSPTPPICVEPDAVTNVRVSCPNCSASNNTSPSTSPDISWKIKGMELAANKAYIQIGTTKIPIVNNATLDGSTTSYQVGNVYKQMLEGTWHGVNGVNGNEVVMLMSMNLEYTLNQGWKITEVTTSDGDENSSNFLHYDPKTKTGIEVGATIGNYYTNTSSATEFTSTDGNATIHFENFKLGAFLNGVGN